MCFLCHDHLSGLWVSLLIHGCQWNVYNGYIPFPLAGIPPTSFYVVGLVSGSGWILHQFISSTFCFPRPMLITDSIPGNTRVMSKLSWFSSWECSTALNSLKSVFNFCAYLPSRLRISSWFYQSKPVTSDCLCSLCFGLQPSATAGRTLRLPVQRPD